MGECVNLAGWVVMNEIFTVKLPWPPSINQYWRTIYAGRATRTLISKKARKFRADVISIISSCGLHSLRLDGRLSARITLHPPTKARRDVDNYAKGILDAFTHACVWNDDEQIDELHIYRGRVEKGGKVVVTVSSLDRRRIDECLGA